MSNSFFPLLAIQDIQIGAVEIKDESTNDRAHVTAANELKVTVAGIAGTSDVNLKEVGGVATSLGQKAMAASLPVVLPSDQDVEVVGNIAHDTADSGNPVKTGRKFNAVLPTVVDGDRVDSQANEHGQDEIAGYDRITKSLAMTQLNEKSAADSEYITLFTAETGPNTNSSTIDNKMFYEFWHIHIDLLVAGGAGAGTIFLEVKTQNRTQWDTYDSFVVPAAIGNHGDGFTIPEKIDQWRLRVAGLANITVDAEAIGGG